MEMDRLATQRSMNKWAARAIPVILFGISGYASYVVVERVCVRFFLRPPPDLGLVSQPPTMIGILVAFFILMVLWIVPYVRIIQVIITDPGLVPRKEAVSLPSANSTNDAKNGSRTASRIQSHDVNRALEGTGHPYAPDGVLDRRAILEGEVPPPPGLEKFYEKNIFVCDYTGLPIWCIECRNWKPDRTHHSSELGRCVRRMDHYCPWVGGIVSETNMKFFVQFLVYAALCTGFIMSLLAYVVSVQRRSLPEIDPHVIVVLAIASLFFFFTAGLGGSTIHLALLNLTTVDNLGRGNHIYFLAVRIDEDAQNFGASPSNANGGQGGSAHYTQVTYPFQRLSIRGQDANNRENVESGAHAFAILRTPSGDNPFYISRLRNMQELMGYTILDWLLPFKYSPLCDHSSPESDFVMGPLVEQLKHDAGLSDRRSRSRHRKKRRRRRRDPNEDSIV
ncbi:zf-DHHC-domain-containing protein [Eremomyces bilateralis CBS 781.70]|uniref:Palmitoyltransferase n=1 Tax=Eremomyces bilateralis CBS 781.70 TaxID=1392243 RepID=A0A6G1GFA4_9PEZI|nr:zf-DHHC-domain-containing protein [Eremomyces bilateralis CBS 781.70]KAF1816559.1 zf-DHHC-domain-containing protein [Eremomyces bilateralis CBS 781.70]